MRQRVMRQEAGSRRVPLGWCCALPLLMVASTVRVGWFATPADAHPTRQQYVHGLPNNGKTKVKPPAKGEIKFFFDKELFPIQPTPDAPSRFDLTVIGGSPGFKVVGGAVPDPTAKVTYPVIDGVKVELLPIIEVVGVVKTAKPVTFRTKRRRRRQRSPAPKLVIAPFSPKVGQFKSPADKKALNKVVKKSTKLLWHFKSRRNGDFQNVTPPTLQLEDGPACPKVESVIEDLGHVVFPARARLTATGLLHVLGHLVCGQATLAEIQSLDRFMGLRVFRGNHKPSSHTFTVSVSKSGTGSGTVTATDRASGRSIFTCGTVCAGTVPAGTIVDLRATPDSHSTFAGWGGDCLKAGTAPCSLGIQTRNARATARFDAKPSGPPKTCAGSATAGSGQDINYSFKCPHKPKIAKFTMSVTTASGHQPPINNSSGLPGFSCDVPPSKPAMTCTASPPVDGSNPIAGAIQTAAGGCPGRTLTITVTYTDNSQETFTLSC